MSKLTKLVKSISSKLSEELTSLGKRDNEDFYQSYLIRSQHLQKVPDYIKVGNLVSENLNYPALINLPTTKGLAFELNDSNREEICHTIESIALQIYSQMNTDFFKFTIIDPKKLGSNFQNIRRLDKKLIGNIVFDQEDISKSINYHYNQSVKVINECLIHYSSIEDYNKKTGEKQPFRFIFISDFPYGFRDSLDKLNTILHNSQEAGVFIFMVYDPSIDIGTYQPKVLEVINLMTRLNEFGNPVNDFYKIHNIADEDLYNNEFTLKLDRSEINPDRLKHHVEDILSTDKKEVNFSMVDGLRIPIGKVAGRTHYLTIGHDTDNYHGIIGGQSGKGKTVLLNNIIARGIETYNTNDLNFFLIDCSGVGFQEFEGSPHVMELCSSGNVEVCVESLKKLEQEKIKREMLFKENRVSELRDYTKKTGKKLPRIMCMIDEFHVLFTGSSRTTNWVESLLVNELIRVWRKFGIHLIVSTQSLGGGVRKSILDNIPLRIALGMTGDQSSSFLGFKNEAAANLERGVAIYNSQNGSPKANKTVKINYISPNDIESLITASTLKAENFADHSLN